MLMHTQGVNGKSFQLEFCEWDSSFSKEKILSSTNEKFNLEAIKHHSALQYTQSFAAAALFGLVWPVAYGG